MEAPQPQEPVKPKSFRPLRNDLRLLPGSQDDNGAPTWTIHDLSRNSFYRIGWVEFEILSRWNMGDVELVVERINSETPLTIDEDDIKNFMLFLNNNQLLVAQSQQERDMLKMQYIKERQMSIMKTLKYYIFFKIALFKPDRFLNILYPKVKFIFSKTTVYIFAVLLFIALYLLLREWEAYTNTFVFFFSFEGAIMSAMTLVVTQAFHEMGHALLAKHYGLRVPSLGVGFIVMFPLLYTDATSAWKLTDKKDRLLVGMAGIITETGLAIISTIVWAILPEGMAKSAAFTVSSITWLMSLAVNLNPLMKFDGYYIASDLLGIDNFQDRSFNYAKWFLRNLVLGLQLPPPEFVKWSRKIIYISYAYSVWIYRFFLFLGIALAVYHYYFKLLGLVLFSIEIGYFLSMPIAKELKVWWGMRQMIHPNKNLFGAGFLVCVLIGLLIYPWQNYLEQRAVIRAEGHRIFAPTSAQIENIVVADGDFVHAGDTLFTLHDQRLDVELDIAKIQAEKAEITLQRTSLSDKYRGDYLVSQQGAIAAQRKEDSIRSDIDKLLVKSTSNGVFKSASDTLHEGMWIPEASVMGWVVDKDRVYIETYVNEKDLDRISIGKNVVFHNDMNDKTVNGKVLLIDAVAAHTLEAPELATLYGGDIPADPADRKEKINAADRQMIKITPRDAVYRVVIKPEILDGESYLQVQRGWVYMEADRQSFIVYLFTKALSVLIREAGF